MIREQERYFFPLKVFLDFISIIITYGICSTLSFKIIALSSNLFTAPSYPYFTHLRLPFYWDRYLNLVPFLFILPLVFLNLTHSYRHIGMHNVRTIIRQTGLSCFLTAGIFFAFLLMYPPLRNDVCFISMFIPLSWLLFAGNRIIMSWLIKHEQKKGKFIQCLLIIGTNDMALRVTQLFDTHPEWGVRVVGFLTNDKNEVGKIYFESKVTGMVEDLASVLEKNTVDCIFFSMELDDLSLIRNLMRRCEIEGIDFAFTPSTLGEKFGNVFAESLGGVSVVLLKSASRSPEKLFLKRLSDIFVSAVLIFLSLPLWVIIPVLIKRDSSGPAFFSQERVGRNGRRFIIYKFRTMVAGAEKMQEKLRYLNEVDGPAFKMKNDPRVTRIGRFLRRTSLDELPQVFNVLKGDMSMVGPRPPIFSEVVQYRLWEKKRLSVTPGITCLWQISGRSELKFDEWMKLDIQYIENWSLTLDLKILLRTISAVLSLKGAQ